MEKNVENKIKIVLEKMAQTIQNENKEYMNARDFEYAFYKSLVKNFKNISIHAIEKDIKGYSNKINRALFQLYISKSFKRLILNFKTIEWINRISIYLIKLLNWDGKSELRLDFMYLKNSLFRIRNPTRWKLFIGIIAYNDLEISPNLRELMDTIFKFASYGNCEYLLKKILEIYEETYPRLRTEHLPEKSIDSEDEFDSDEKEDSDSIENEDIDSEFSKEKFKQLYTENIALQRQLDAAQGTADYFRLLYTEKVEEIKLLNKNYEREMKIKIFQSFNSVQSNNTLDNFHIAKQLMQKLKEENWEPNHPDLNDLLYVINLFDEFLQSQKVFPIHNAGEIIDLSFENAINYDYQGSDYISNQDVKKVKVKAPGWRIDNIVICKPTVIETQKSN